MDFTKIVPTPVFPLLDLCVQWFVWWLFYTVGFPCCDSHTMSKLTWQLTHFKRKWCDQFNFMFCTQSGKLSISISNIECFLWTVLIITYAILPHYTVSLLTRIIGTFLQTISFMLIYQDWYTILGLYNKPVSYT